MKLEIKINKKILLVEDKLGVFWATVNEPPPAAWREETFRPSDVHG